MILTTLYSFNELDKMADGIIISHNKYSFFERTSFTTQEIIKLKGLTTKKVFLSILPIYHDDELFEIDELISELSILDGFFFSDLGLVDIFKKYNILDKAIYTPETFITTHLDKDYYKEVGLKSYTLSREITLDNIKKILLYKEDVKYAYNIFGHQNIFYSYRKHYTNFSKHYGLNLNLTNDENVYLKEETRNDMYPSIEDKYGFRIYKDKIFNGYSELDSIKDVEFFILDRKFIDDNMYFDTIDLYLNRLSITDYNKKYNGLCDLGYLYKETGLLRGDSDE